MVVETQNARIILYEQARCKYESVLRNCVVNNHCFICLLLQLSRRVIVKRMKKFVNHPPSKGISVLIVTIFYQ